VFAVLEAAPAGLHDITAPSGVLPVGLPGGLIELYACCDGALLYHDTVELVASREVAPTDRGRWRFGTIEGDELSIDARGKIWRADSAIDDEVCDGTRIDRWLAGAVDALGLLYDAEGEFADDVFDDDGELLPKIAERTLRAQLKRDAGAPGPRWRLAHVLLHEDAVENARSALEQVVADDPAFAWGWLDLARISEKLGELSGALDEARMAADAADRLGHPQTGYFWAQLARIAYRAGDELVRADAATHASLRAPELKRAQLEGASERLEAGDRASARGLLELLRAVWPRDLEVLELAKRVES
jgi:tetratricopeptide (TPR) repeat protein